MNHKKNLVKYLFPYALVCALTANVYAQEGTQVIGAQKNLSADWEKSLYDTKPIIYHDNQLTTIGMPVGGIAAGQLYVRGDGSLAQWWIANNAFNTGGGAHTELNNPLGEMGTCYRTFTPSSFIDQGFKIKAQYGGKVFEKQLNNKGFNDISFKGEYPIATINYNNKDEQSPVSVSMKIFSPFVPLNSRESATPGTYIIFHVKNNSGQQMKANLSGWLQNPVLMELAGKATGYVRNRAITANGMQTLLMDFVSGDKGKLPTIKKYDDFESGTYKGWHTNGDAFNKPVQNKVGIGMPTSDFSGNYLAGSVKQGRGVGTLVSDAFVIRDNYLNFQIGGDKDLNKTGARLLVNGQAVLTATGSGTKSALEKISWNLDKWKGQKAKIEIYDQATGPNSGILVDNITFSDLPTNRIYEPVKHPYYGNLALSVINPSAKVFTDISKRNNLISKKLLGQNLTGDIEAPITLAPGEQKDVVFLLTWYFPNRPKNYGNGNNWDMPIPTDGPLIGNMYSNWYHNSTDVANYLKNNQARLVGLTDLFHDAYYNNSSLPAWLNNRLMMPVANLATETCQWWADGKFYGWEGVGSCVGTCTHVWNYEQAMASFFPDLERNVRERTDFATSYQEDGGILTRNGQHGVKMDGQAGTILKSYREYLNSADNSFLVANWAKIKKATQYLIAQDALDGKTDGMLEGEQRNTYDLAFYGANTFVDGLYLASLKAAAQMARLMSDETFASICLNLAKSGEDYTTGKLWNGQYYVQGVSFKDYPQFQYADGCLSDQLFGQTWAHMLNLGYIYPEKQVKKTLASIWQYNWTKDVGGYATVYKPQRTYAKKDDPGLINCSWPLSTHPKGPLASVRYRDEVWTGVEYQVATNMIYDGLVKEGLSVIKGIDDRYSPEKHNPWNEIECGDHYARAMASWGAFKALSKFYYNGPEGILAYNPVLSPDKFESFFTAANGWGNITQQRTDKSQTNQVILKYGDIQLRELRLAVPDGVSPSEITVKANNKKINAKWKTDGNTVTVSSFDVVLHDHEALAININY